MILKVLHIICGLNSGGTERQLIEFIKNADKKELVCGIVTFNTKQHYSSIAKAECSYYRELHKRPTRLEPLFTIWRCLIEYKPDIVQTWDSLSTFYSWLPGKVLGIPIIDGSIRDAGVDKGLSYHFRRVFLRQAQAIVANSKAGLKAYKVDGYVIYNSINSSRFLPRASSEEFNLIMTASFSKYKDQKTFLIAAVDLVSNNIVDHVYLPGNGPFKEKYISWIKENYPKISNRFLFPGTVHNVEDYLAKCHIGVLCSTVRYGEGISNSVLEYMAAGLLPIATNIGGSSEIINDGVNGFLIKAEDSSRIIELVSSIKQDSELFERIVNEAKQTISDKFSVSQNSKKIYALYLKIKKENL